MIEMLKEKKKAVIGSGDAGGCSGVSEVRR